MLNKDGSELLITRWVYSVVDTLDMDPWRLSAGGWCGTESGTDDEGAGGGREGGSGGWRRASADVIGNKSLTSNGPYRMDW